MPHPEAQPEQHPDGDELTLVALGEPAPGDVATHLAGCPVCRGQVEQLRRVVAEARSLGDAEADVAGGPNVTDVTDGADVRLVPPPPAVWTAVAEATGVSTPARPARVAAAAGSLAELAPEVVGRWKRSNGVDPAAVRRAWDTGSIPVLTPAAQVPAAAPVPAVPLPAAVPVPAPRRPARRRSDTLVSFVAALALLVGLAGGAGGVLALQRWGEQPATTAPSVLSRATLAALPDAPTAAGRADVVQTGSGRQLQVSVRRLAAAPGFYEVWLAVPSLKTMLPVGVLQDDEGTFDLPANIDPASYPTVDVSWEPVDGNPAHSTHSVLRGTLQS